MLLADTEGSMCSAYGVIRDGESGFDRSTVIIDSEGKIAKVMRSVDPTEHIAEVEKFVRDNLQ